MRRDTTWLEPIFRAFPIGTGAVGARASGKLESNLSAGSRPFSEPIFRGTFLPGRTRLRIRRQGPGVEPAPMNRGPDLPWHHRACLRRQRDSNLPIEGRIPRGTVLRVGIEPTWPAPVTLQRIEPCVSQDSNRIPDKYRSDGIDRGSRMVAVGATGLEPWSRTPAATLGLESSILGAFLPQIGVSRHPSPPGDTLRCREPGHWRRLPQLSTGRSDADIGRVSVRRSRVHTSSLNPASFPNQRAARTRRERMGLTA